MRRRLLSILLSAALLALVAALAVGSIAYFTHEDTAVNVITTGSVGITLHEKTASGEDFPKEGVFVMPGDTVSKIVTVENTGEAPCFVRVALEEGVNNELLSADGCLEMDINTADWTYKDGYYYYHNVLIPGETTNALFTEVHIVGDAVTNEYMNADFNINVSAYAVQSDNNGSSALEALGWPA